MEEKERPKSKKIINSDIAKYPIIERDIVAAVIDKSARARVYYAKYKEPLRCLQSREQRAKLRPLNIRYSLFTGSPSGE
jgi:hypothetical protein